MVGLTVLVAPVSPHEFLGVTVIVSFVDPKSRVICVVLFPETMDEPPLTLQIYLVACVTSGME